MWGEVVYQPRKCVRYGPRRIFCARSSSPHGNFPGLHFCKHLEHITPQIPATQLLLKQQPTSAPRRSAKRALKSAHFGATQVATAALSRRRGGHFRSVMSMSDILRTGTAICGEIPICTRLLTRFECWDGGVGASRDRGLGPSAARMSRQA